MLSLPLIARAPSIADFAMLICCDIIPLSAERFAMKYDARNAVSAIVNIASHISGYCERSAEYTSCAFCIFVSNVLRGDPVDISTASTNGTRVTANAGYIVPLLADVSGGVMLDDVVRNCRRKRALRQSLGYRYWNNHGCGGGSVDAVPSSLIALRSRLRSSWRLQNPQFAPLINACVFGVKNVFAHTAAGELSIGGKPLIEVRVAPSARATLAMSTGETNAHPLRGFVYRLAAVSLSSLSDSTAISSI